MYERGKLCSRVAKLVKSHRTGPRHYHHLWVHASTDRPNLRLRNDSSRIERNNLLVSSRHDRIGVIASVNGNRERNSNRSQEGKKGESDLHSGG